MLSQLMEFTRMVMVCIFVEILLLIVSDLKTDESAMTGETHEIKKDSRQPFMLSGCQVTSGTGQMVVTGVGVLSEWGMTLSKLTEERDPTPLQDKLENVANTISKAGVAVAVLTFVALTIIWIVRIAQFGWQWERLNELVSFFIIGVAIIAVAVPEGLPLAVTIALAYSMKKMYAFYSENAICIDFVQDG